MKVQEIMSAKPVCCAPDTSIREVAEMMVSEDVGEIPVCDDEGKPLGVVTDRDIVVRAVAERCDPAATTIGEIVTKDLVTVRPDDSIHSAALLMRDQAVRRILVCDDHQGLVGIVSIGDLAEEIDPDSVLGGISKARPNN